MSTPTPTLNRARNQGHSPFNDMVREDWKRLVESHPDSFDVLIYVPGVATVPAEGDAEALFGSLDRHQQAVTYEDPFVISALAAAQEDPLFSAMWDEAETLGTGDADTLSLLLSVGVAPLGSIVEFEEEIASGQTRRVWWYVHHVDAVGTASIGALHTCIPCGDLEQARATATEVLTGETE